VITQAELLELFDYKNGEIYWKKTFSKKTKIGNKAGRKQSLGYIQVNVNKKSYLAHRIIFAMHNGCFPKFIDHINGNKSDNRIENLREVTASQNLQNTKKPITNTSGYKNVYFHPSRNKWQVKLVVNKTNKSFGYYDDLELADLVAQEARNKHFGEFACHL
jgi:PBP1b-binding outer membrane lipoprotein LpoB